MTARCAAALLAALVAHTGCQLGPFAGSVSDAELPEQRIAVHYRTTEEARKRGDDFAASRGVPQPPEGTPTYVGSKAQLRADMGALGTFLSNAFGARREPDAHRGRLALIDPRSGGVEVVQGALRGAVPLAWAADRTRLLFAQAPDPDSSDVQIFEWNTEADTVRRVTVGPPIHTEACFGPDGRIVVTAVSIQPSGPVSRIQISQPGGRGPYTDLTSGPSDHSPACAPDGGAVAFARAEPDGRSQIWLLAAPFSAAPRQLAPGLQPRFAGDWVLYTAARGRASRIFRVRADGSGRAPIGQGARDEGWPTASPDGRLVAFVEAAEVPHTRLLVRRFDGTGDRILLASGEGEFPVW